VTFTFTVSVFWAMMGLSALLLLFATLGTLMMVNGSNGFKKLFGSLLLSCGILVLGCNNWMLYKAAPTLGTSKFQLAEEELVPGTTYEAVTEPIKHGERYYTIVKTGNNGTENLHALASTLPPPKNGVTIKQNSGMSFVPIGTPSKDSAGK